MRTAVVVDFDMWERSFTMAALADHGFATLGASNGASGLRLVERNACDVILLDFALPEVSGREVLRQLRNVDATRNIPVVALGDGRADKGCVVEGWLNRPFTQRDVQDQVARVVTVRSPHAEVGAANGRRGSGSLVLVASPDRALAAHVAELMRNSGSVACTAHSADGCLRVATSVGPDLVILDPRLSTRNELENRLRAHPVSAAAQIVPLSSQRSGIASIG
jgi:DNA-binding response OmpR family regulator